MKAITVDKVDGGYVIQFVENGRRTVSVATKFKQVREAVRGFFTDDVSAETATAVVEPEVPIGD